MTRTCCIRECNFKSGMKIRLFKIPKDPCQNKLWMEAIVSHLKKVKHLSNLFVCENHFEPDHLEKYFITVLENGTVNKIPREFAKLKLGAVPSVFLDGDGKQQRSVDVEKENVPQARQMDTTYWTPIQIIKLKDHDDFNYAVLVLNTKITVPEKLTCSLWQNANYRVLVDGGVNQWLSFIHDRRIDASELKEPDLINGDFDSVSDDSLNLFRFGSTIIEHTPDQDETDFTKAIRLLEPIVKAKKLSSIITIQEHGSRLDQIMANINTLYKAAEILNNTHTYLISGGSLTWLLNPGKHSISVPLDLVEDERWCAMIPLSGKAIVTTKGLKWDLENSELEFGKLVSTSNTYASENLEITTDRVLLWSMGVFHFD